MDGGVHLCSTSRHGFLRRVEARGNVGRLDTARPQISHVALAFCQLSPRSLLLTLSPRVSCAARPHVRRPSAARERSALWWRHELLCQRLWAAKGPCQTPPFPDRASNQNGKATLASPARRLPETCVHRTVAYMCPASERQQPVRFRSSISAPHAPADTPLTEPTRRRISSLCGRAARSASALKRGRKLKMLLIRFQLFFASTY